MSLETGVRGRTQMPALSGGNSHGSRGAAPSGIRVTLRGTTSMGGPPPLPGGAPLLIPCSGVDSMLQTSVMNPHSRLLLSDAAVYSNSLICST